MITKILPLTKNKLIVLEELYKFNELNMSTISKNANLVNPLVSRTLKELKEILEVRILENIKLYFIK